MSKQSFKTKVAVSLLMIIAVTCSAGSNQSFNLKGAVRDAPREAKGQTRELSAEDLRFSLTRNELTGLFEHQMVDYFLTGIGHGEKKRHAQQIRLALKDTPNAAQQFGEIQECIDDDECGAGFYCDRGVCRPLPKPAGESRTIVAGDGDQAILR
jgi:hypothetical protein